MTNCIRQQSGFTLIEAIMVMTITAILAAGVAVFLRKPIDGYLDLARRAELSDIADTAVRRISRDLHLALPNSVRIVPADKGCLEFIPTINGGRYRADVGALGVGNVFDTATALTKFDVLGPLSAAPTTLDRIVVFNLGIPGADAYAGNNIATVASGSTASLINLSPSFQFPFTSPGSRFHLISKDEQSVFYVCTSVGTVGGNGTGTLFRLTRAITTTAPATCPAISAATPILAQNLSACEFIYANSVGVATERNGLVAIRLAVTKQNETANLYHEVHINNVP
jgi:MSHA biogenesis protein MshO